MSFETGTTALLICPLTGRLPDDFLERFAQRSAGKLDDVKEDPVVGWVSGRHLLENEITETTSLCGGHLYINLRKAERKIPSQLLNAICKREELAYMQANDTISVPKKERKRIKEDAIERNLMKMPPTISAIPIVVDRTENVLYFGSGSLSAFDNFLPEFMRAVEVEPVPISPAELMLAHCNDREENLPILSFNGDENSSDEPATGRDFLTWLWFFSEKKSGLYSHPQYGEFAIMLEGPLTLAFSKSKAKDPSLCGSGESVVKKGNPILSPEANAALKDGKKLRKARIVIARGDSEKWTFTFDADTFAFSGLSLPEGEEQDLNGRFEERVLFLSILHAVMAGLFKIYADSVSAGKIRDTLNEIKFWVQERSGH